MNIRKPNKITRIFDRTLDLFSIFAGALVVFIALGITTDVALRYFWNSPIFWMTEVTEDALLWICFLVAAWLLRSEGHVKMDLVVSRLKPGTQTLINIITSVISTVAVLVLTWYGGVQTWASFKGGYAEVTPLGPPIAPIQVIIPIGGFLLFIQLLRRTYGYWHSWRVLRTEEPGWPQADKEGL